MADDDDKRPPSLQRQIALRKEILGSIAGRPAGEGRQEVLDWISALLSECAWLGALLHNQHDDREKCICANMALLRELQSHFPSIPGIGELHAATVKLEVQR